MRTRMDPITASQSPITFKALIPAIIAAQNPMIIPSNSACKALAFLIDLHPFLYQNKTLSLFFRKIPYQIHSPSEFKRYAPAPAGPLVPLAQTTLGSTRKRILDSL